MPVSPYQRPILHYEPVPTTPTPAPMTRPDGTVRTPRDEKQWRELVEAYRPKRRSPMPKELREVWKARFLLALSEGLPILAAAKLAGVSSNAPAAERRRDPEFAAAWLQAAAIGTERLEEEAARRAYHGTLEPVYHKGQICGYTRKYSDVLLIFLLKARKPEMYRDSDERGGAGSLSNSIKTAATAVAVLNQMREAGSLNLPAPQVIESVPVEVTSNTRGDETRESVVQLPPQGAPAE